jgi:tetratricopeptide (TPR) repeat protein
MLGVCTVLVAPHRGPDQEIWRVPEARGAFRLPLVEALTADAVTVLRTTHEVLAQERWTEATALTPTGAIAGSHVPLLWVATTFAQTVGAARTGQPLRARQALAELRGLHDSLRGTRQRDWAAQVELLCRVAAAWVAQRDGQYAEADQHLHAAEDRADTSHPDPVLRAIMAAARALWGELLLERGEGTRALRVLERALVDAPHQGKVLYQAAHAAELAEELARARDLYTELLGRPQGATDNPIPLAQARAFLANLQGCGR